MKNLLSVALICALSFAGLAQETDSLSIVDQVEQAAVTSLDGFIEKYGDVISEKVSWLGAVVGDTAIYSFELIVTYLIIKNGVNVAIGILVVLIGFWFYWFIRRILKRYKEDGEDYEYRSLYGAQWIALVPWLVGSVIFFYNVYYLLLAVIVPEIRVLLWLENMVNS